MKKTVLLFSFLLVGFSIQVFSQYAIGHQSLTYLDPARSNRSVTTEAYYPATTAGESTPFAAGQFPLIVFGHGFVMGYDAYAYFKDAMVPLGYIVVYATTESSMSPVHSDFGLDLAFLVSKIKSEAAANGSSPFYNKLSATSAIMGHSMGGGSSFLACENNTVPTCMVTFAAANTTPSSITAAQNVTIPCLVISGSDDCVAPPADNQIPMYDSLASACKVYVSITGGGHCYFADYNFNCTFGEQTCHPGSMDITRADQEDATLDFVKLYLDFYLKGNNSSWTVFDDSLTLSPRITFEKSCPTTGLEEMNNYLLSIWPNPASSQLYVSFGNSEISSLRIFDIAGRILIDKVNSSLTNVETADISSLSSGIYTVEVVSGKTVAHKKFFKE